MRFGDVTEIGAEVTFEGNQAHKSATVADRRVW
jgi:hypothetical protein